jgi:hypothetical protein
MAFNQDLEAFASFPAYQAYAILFLLAIALKID